MSYQRIRSIDYPAHRVRLKTFPPPVERRDLGDAWVDGSPYSVVRVYPNFDLNPGTQGDITVVLVVFTLNRSFYPTT